MIHGSCLINLSMEKIYIESGARCKEVLRNKKYMKILIKPINDGGN